MRVVAEPLADEVLEAIRAQLARSRLMMEAEQSPDLVVVHAAEVLLAEVDRLRGERPAVCAWLRATARGDIALCGDVPAESGAMLHAAMLIERGVHRG